MNPNVKTEPQLATTAPAVCRGPIEKCPKGTCARCEGDDREARTKDALIRVLFDLANRA